MTLSPHEVATRSAEAMWAQDRASRSLGMALVEVAPGRATVRMTLREDMVNGHGIGHGLVVENVGRTIPMDHDRFHAETFRKSE